MPEPAVPPPIEHPEAATVSASAATVVRDALAKHAAALREAVSPMVKARVHARERGDVESLIDEVLSQTIVTLLEIADRFDPQQPIVPWAMGVAVNVWRSHRLNHARAQARSAAQDHNVIPARPPFQPPDPKQVDPAAAAEWNEEVAHYLSLLPENQAQLLRLRYLNGLAYEEIARSLGLKSADSARVQTTRALTKLKEHAARKGGRS